MTPTSTKKTFKLCKVSKCLWYCKPTKLMTVDVLVVLGPMMLRRVTIQDIQGVCFFFKIFTFIFQKMAHVHEDEQTSGWCVSI